MEVMEKITLGKMTLVTFLTEQGTLRKWAKGKKGKADDSNDSCHLQRLSGRIFISVEDATSPQGVKKVSDTMVCGPFKLNPNKVCSLICNFSLGFLGSHMGSIDI